MSGSADVNTHPMVGQVIDVGGHSLYLRCTGSGSPTVVLEPGQGEMSAALGWIGRGHSFGGLSVLTCAARYPDDVAGLVMVDSTAPATEAATPAANSTDEMGSYDVMAHVSALAASSARLGLGRLIAKSDFGSLPPRSRDEARASGATPNYLQGWIDEFVMANASVEEAAALVDFADKPLAVVTAGIGSDDAWLAAQDHLATLSSNRVHRVIDGADHIALLHDEQGAAATTRAILDVVSSIRNDDPLVE